MARFSLFRSQSVKQATALLAVTALLSNGLGLSRNLIFYRNIAPGELDVYFASFRIADLILNILIVGAIGSAVIPTVSALIAKHREKQAWELTNALLSWATVGMVAVILLLSMAMPVIIPRLVSGFDPHQISQTVVLSRFLLLQALFYCWSFIVGALLNSYRRFAGYAIAPLIYNVSLITGGILAGRYGVSILIYAVIVGSFFHFLIQFLEAYRLGFRPALRLAITPELTTILRLMVPRSLSQGMAQIVLLAYTNLASGLPKGSLAIFNGMNDLQTTPTVIVANSLATASFPAMAAQASEGKFQEVNDLVRTVIRTCLFLLIPSSILGLVLRAQIARLYVGIGSANWNLTHVAITTLAWFMVGIVPSALVVILSRVFYATNDTRTPMVINSVTSVVGIVLSWIGIHHYGATVSMLALSESLIAASQALFYLLILHRRGIVTVHGSTLYGKRGSYLFGSVLSGLAAWLTLHVVNFIYTATHVRGTASVAGLLVQATAALAVGLCVYFGYSNLQNKEELQWLRKRRFSHSQ